MKNSIYILAAIATIVTLNACGNKNEGTTQNGISYDIHRTTEDGKILQGDTTALLFAHYSLHKDSADSLLAETFTTGNPVYIPVVEPNFREVFGQLRVGDSAIMRINADTFFLKSFGQPRPPYFNEGEKIRFTIKVMDILSESEIVKKQEEERKSLIEKDSLEREKAISLLNNPQKTASGLAYEVMKKGTSTIIKKGQKVTVLYKGYFLNGQVFDENLKDGFKDLPVGLGQVIPGWEEMLQLMHVGEKVKVIIPWDLAYGPRGMQAIPPYSTLVFEMEVLSAK
ncbi:MAG: FKBP-type peptidyl-prolyl cis-trans isomerase [Bacteroidia bacterium]|nr:FKBP-type peptidyl-prolyl cis-trans isomerase [Bacteroidia bacterium]MCC7532308.1 FKBP-type peptidyl-prolyl cis-trans isomerase [Bacteroidia bacterium]